MGLLLSGHEKASSWLMVHGRFMWLRVAKKKEREGDFESAIISVVN